MESLRRDGTSSKSVARVNVRALNLILWLDPRQCNSAGFLDPERPPPVENTPSNDSSNDSRVSTSTAKPRPALASSWPACFPRYLLFMLLECLPLRPIGISGSGLTDYFLINFTDASQLVYIVPGFTFGLTHRIIVSTPVATGCTGFSPFGECDRLPRFVHAPELGHPHRDDHAHDDAAPLGSGPVHPQLRVLALSVAVLSLLYRAYDTRNGLPSFQDPERLPANPFPVCLNSGTAVLGICCKTLCSARRSHAGIHRGGYRGSAKATKLIKKRRALLPNRGNERRLSSSGKTKMEELIALILSIAENPFDEGSFKNIRPRACVPHGIPAHCIGKLDVLRTLNMIYPASYDSTLPSQGWYKRSFIGVPASIAPVQRLTRYSDQDPLTRRVLRAERSKNFVGQGLQLLFHSKYLTLFKTPTQRGLLP
ncbi:hypothetical protein ON010_g2826 [Phytophthora cinnamomi]|nr:hypothetical protein ON010_g2826 [Phytophthora cinnamomi]